MNWFNKCKICPICRNEIKIEEAGKDLTASNIIDELDVVCGNKRNKI